MGESRIQVKGISDIKVSGNDLMLNKAIVIFGIVTRLEEKSDKNLKKYIEFVLDDRTGEVVVKVWGTSLADIQALGIKNASFVKLGAIVSKWQDKAQLKADIQNEVLMLRLVDSEKDSVVIDDYVKTAPIEGIEMFEEILITVKSFDNAELKAIALEVMKTYKKELLIYPGSKTVHHACRSGLLFHIYSMFKLAKAMEQYSNINMELLYTGILIHDIGKIKELEVSELGLADDYTITGSLLGHIIDGVRMMDIIFIKLGTVENISVLLHHMISSHHHEANWGAYQMPKFLEAQMLHHLDAVDSRVNQIDHGIQNVEPGTFGEKMFFMNNRAMFMPDLSYPDPIAEQVESKSHDEKKEILSEAS